MPEISRYCSILMEARCFGKAIEMILKELTLSDDKFDRPGVYHEKVITLYDTTIILSYTWVSAHGNKTNIVEVGHTYGQFIYTRIKRRII